MSYWIWVFGDVEALRWVVGERRMAFANHASKRVASMAVDDRAVLYLTRGAFHNPTRDVARLAGIATVQSSPGRVSPPLSIAGREFSWSCEITIDTLLPEREGPAVGELASKLSLVRKPEAWGQYFRQSPIPVSADDFELLADAVRHFARTGRH